VLGALGALGATFGACPTEYAGATEGGRGPALIEGNDRLIGDHCDFVLSDLLGVLTAGPAANPRPPEAPDVLLSYRSLRDPGDRIAVTPTNRDYLGAITAIGRDAAAVERVVTAARESWSVA
jgi:hypothetical protein